MDRYEEALAKARAEYEKARKQGYTWLMNLLEGMFPDLRESEDERIRKAIMEVLKRVSGATDVLENEGTTFKKAMIWLEKQKELPTNEEMLRTLRVEYEKGVADTIAKYEQKEQKPVTYEDDFVSEHKTSLEILKHYLIWAENSEEDCPYTWKELAAAIKDGITALEQKPAEWDDYTKTNLDRALQIIKDAKGTLQGYQSDDGIYECDKAIECLEHFLYRGLEIEKTIEWSEEDENMRGTCIYLLEHDEVIGPWKDCIAWLKSLPERFNLQPKQEWSEEDEKHIEALILASDRCMGKWHCCNEQCEISEHLDWLKSLRPPQYCENCKLKRSFENWKPSKQ